MSDVTLPSAINRPRLNWSRVMSERMSDLARDTKSNLSTLIALGGVLVGVITISVTVAIFVIRWSGDADQRYSALAQIVSGQSMQISALQSAINQYGRTSEEVSALSTEIKGISRSIDRAHVHADATDAMLSNMNDNVTRLGQKFDDAFGPPKSGRR